VATLLLPPDRKAETRLPIMPRCFFHQLRNVLMGEVKTEPPLLLLLLRRTIVINNLPRHRLLVLSVRLRLKWRCGSTSSNVHPSVDVLPIGGLITGGGGGMPMSAATTSVSVPLSLCSGLDLSGNGGDVGGLGLQRRGDFALGAGGSRRIEQ
jgi:hypothetical protein